MRTMNWCLLFTLLLTLLMKVASFSNWIRITTLKPTKAPPKPREKWRPITETRRRDPCSLMKDLEEYHANKKRLEKEREEEFQKLRDNDLVCVII